MEQIDLDALALECSLATKADESAARDALLDVLSYLWQHKETYADSFASLLALKRYLKLSATRHIIRQNQLSQRTEPLSLHTPHNDKTAEEQMLSLLQIQECAAWLHAAHQHIPRRKAKDASRLIKLILARPEQYITTRQSGKEAGQYTFAYSKIASKLGWPRRKVYEQLSTLREALRKESTKSIPGLGETQ
jgi:hypothetical protein